MMGPGNQGPPAGGGGGGFMGGGGGPPAGSGGGYAPQGGPAYAPVPATPQPMGGHDVVAIEKKVPWKLAFFGGACCATATGLITVIHYVFSLFQVSGWSPCTFISGLFLTLFGIFMLILDAPIPIANPSVTILREHLYRFALFLTRFTGRGVWYLFLGTHVWVALYDSNISAFFAVLFTLYLVLLGGASIAKGIILSMKLNDIRKTIIAEQKVRPESYMTRGADGMNDQEFKRLVGDVKMNPEFFTEAELAYVMNALSFSSSSELKVTLEEYQFWMEQKDCMLLV